MKQRGFIEATQLLERHGVPDDLTLKQVYKDTHNLYMDLPWAIHRKTRMGKLLEEFAEDHGFTHWNTLKALFVSAGRK